MKKINKIISVILLVFILLILSQEIKANSTINLKIESKEVNSEEFTIKIIGDNIDKNNTISGIKMDLFYDKDTFQVIDGSKLKAAGSAINLYENYANEGRVRIGIVSMLGMSKSGELYEIKFKITNTEKLNNNSEFKLSIKEVTDEQGNILDTSTENGIITFSNINKNNANEESTDSKIIINIDENNDNIDNIEISENLDISLNDTNIKKQNIDSIINERKTNLDINTNLSYKVENEDIIYIDEYGNIIAKSTGNTNIIVTDEKGNEEIIPVSIINNSMKETSEYKEYENKKNSESENTESDNNKNIIYNLKEKVKKSNVLIITVTIIVLISIILIILIRRKNK